jgi:hypothetical protein
LEVEIGIGSGIERGSIGVRDIRLHRNSICKVEWKTNVLKDVYLPKIVSCRLSGGGDWSLWRKCQQSFRASKKEGAAHIAQRKKE